VAKVLAPAGQSPGSITGACPQGQSPRPTQPDLRFAICLRCVQDHQQLRDAPKAPRDINSRPAPKTATVAPRVLGGAPCLCQFRIRIQIPPLKHVASRQFLDGMFESLGSMASGTIFRASSRTGKRSAGLKTKARRGCRRGAKRPSLILRFRDRSETHAWLQVWWSSPLRNISQTSTPGLVCIHCVQRTTATTLIIAAKHVSVFS
jgi:hypothetical protein